MRRFFTKIIQILDGTPAEYGKPRQRGQSFVELAFITPILIIMVAGIVEIGWYANNYINLLEAAKVGARRGPFLTGENSPQEYEEKFLADNNGDGKTDSTSIIHPSIDSSGVSKLPEPTVDNDPVLKNPRYSTRGYTYPLSQTSCENIPVNPSLQFGFYNLIACTVLDSLDPIKLRIGLDDPKEKDPNKPPERYQDDIVISVFSLQKVNNGPVGGVNPDGWDTDGDGVPDGTPYDVDINAVSSIPYDPGHQVIVVGRWPSEANECFDGTNSLEGINRDPFDYIVNGVVDQRSFIVDGKQILLPYELAKPIYNNAGEVYDFEPYARKGNVAERQRGWVLTGQHPITPDKAFNGPCYGSSFNLQQVQEMMNLPRFVNEGDAVINQNRRSYIPSQGMVLVEIFWEHELLMGQAFPLFYGAYNLFANLGGDEAYAQDSNVIHVWSAFPAPAAEPHITYQP